MTFSIYSDDVCVLSAIGTAAIINPQFTMCEASSKQYMPQISIQSKDGDLSRDMRSMHLSGQQKLYESDKNGDNDAQMPSGCSLCHIPPNKIVLPVNGKMKKCSVCK